MRVNHNLRPIGSWRDQILRAMPIARTMLGSLAAAFIAQGALLVSGILAARLLGPENRGHLALLTLIPVVICQLGMLGVEKAVSYHIARNEKAIASIVATARQLGVIQSILCSVINGVVLWSLMGGDANEVRWSAAITMMVPVTIFIRNYVLAILQGMRLFRAYNFQRNVQPFLYAAGLLLLWSLHEPSLLVATGIWTLTSIVSATIGIISVARALPRDARSEVPTPSAGELMRFGAKGFLGSASPLETFRLDQAAVGLFLSPAMLGIYVASLAFTNLPRFVSQSVGMIAFPHIAGQPNDKLAARSMWRFFWLSLAMSIMIATPLIVAAPVLVPLAFGEDFRDAIAPMQILLIGSVIFGARRTLGDGMRGRGMPLATTWAEIASWVCLVPALVIFVQWSELKGIAVAIGASGAVGLAALVFLQRAKELKPTGVPLEKESLSSRLTDVRFVRALFSVHRKARPEIQPSRRNSFGLSIKVVRIATVLLLFLITVLTVGAAIPLLGTGLAILLVVAVIGAAATGIVCVRLGYPGLIMMLFAASFVLLAMNGVRVNSSIAMSDVPLLLAVLLSLPLLMQSRRQAVPRELKRFMIGVTLLIIGSFIATAFSSAVTESLVRLIKMSTSVAVVPLAIVLLAPSTRFLRLLSLLWIASVSLSVFIGVVQGPPHNSSRIIGLATHQNVLAFTCILALGPALAFMVAGNRIERFIALGGTVSVLMGVYFSGSRAGLVGTLVVVLIFAIITRNRVLTLFLTTATLLGVAVGVFGVQVPFEQGTSIERLLHSRSSDVTVAASDEGRQERFAQGIASIEQRPFVGIGLQEARAAHNVYLQVLSASGVIGFVGFIVAIWAALAPLRDRTLRARARVGEKAPLIIVGFGAGYAGFLVGEVFNNSLWERFMWAYPIVGLLLYLRYKEGSSEISTLGLADAKIEWRSR